MATGISKVESYLEKLYSDFRTARMLFNDWMSGARFLSSKCPHQPRSSRDGVHPARQMFAQRTGDDWSSQKRPVANS